MEFIGISSEWCKERMESGDSMDIYSDVILLGSRVLKAEPEFLKYYEWKEKNPYKNKQFSILGDSISTLAGYNPRGYKVFYGGEKSEQSGVKVMNDTWWGKVIDYFGGELLVNNSWSGSRVTKLPSNEALFPSGCSDERTSSLHIGNIKPDVIIVYLGTNDWAFGVKTGNDTRILGEDDNELFLWAYERMLRKLRNNYPDSEIWCCTLCETYVSARPNFKFPHKYAGIHIEEFNEIIRDVVRCNGCRLVDLYSYKMAYDSIDGSHPNNEGMNTIATMIINSMLGTDADQFLDCEEEQHDYEMYEHNAQPMGNSDEKDLLFLEAGMDAFAESGHKDKVALKLIIAALSDAPLYIPVEIDLEAMLSSVDPMKLKPGDILQPAQDVKMRIMTLTYESGIEFVPMFTSNNEANKGLSASMIRFYPQDYLPKLAQMDKTVIINPFSENRFLMTKELITEILLPLVQNETKPQTGVVEQTADKYIGKIIDNKYEVLKLIGRGGFHTTYLVRNIHINKMWAMKVCDKRNKSYSGAIRESILTEPYVMKKLDHPCIPKVVDIIEDEDSLFIIRDYIEGETLETIAERYGAQPADKVIEWAKQMCSTLGYLHSQNPPFIYRDMKPANVILKPDGTIHFIDFGIMRTYKQDQKRDTCCLGTVGYAAPEGYHGQTDPRSDIFGLGMTMFRLVTGINPIEPPYEVKPICQINPNLPKGLEFIISKCTKPNPNERYQTCDELLKDLGDYLTLPKHKGIFSKLFKK